MKNKELYPQRQQNNYKMYIATVDVVFVDMKTFECNSARRILRNLTSPIVVKIVQNILF